MKTEIKNFYSWYYNEDKIMIYKQKQENKNSYNCISQIVQQLSKENNKYTFHISTIIIF